MTHKNYNDIVSPELLVGTLDHNVHTGFLQDYRALSCLLKIYQPSSIFEVGTNVGGGINVMAAALPSAKIYSLDLDYETMKLNSLQYPIGTNGEDRVGSAAKVPYTQLRGDSMTFDYSKYPCEGYFIDGEHDRIHASKETFEVLNCQPKIIIFHDSDMPEVMAGILDGFEKYSFEKLDFQAVYKLFRVDDTRIAYLLKSDLC